MKQGQETKWSRRVREEDRVRGWDDARILLGKPRGNSRRTNAQKNPLRSFAQTAIEVPGFRNHSHQWGIESGQSNPQPSTLAGLTPFVKLQCRGQMPGAGGQGGNRSPNRSPQAPGPRHPAPENHFTSTVAPTSVNFLAMAAASS